MVKLKYKVMAENAFRFYRGTCHLFYEDLSKSTGLPESPLSWICGDLHLENYGSFKADNRLVYFDLNDFDEAILAPCIWEVARMTGSIYVGFAELGLAEGECTKLARLFVKHYAATMAGGKAFSIDPRTANGIVYNFLKKADKRKQKQLLKRHTTIVKHKLFLSQDNAVQFPVKKQLHKDLLLHINKWLKTGSRDLHHFKTMDCVFRLAGTGSIGLNRYLFLLRNLDAKNKYLLLDMKEAVSSSLAPYITTKQPKWDTDAGRVEQIKHRMQNISPALLGTTVFEGQSYVVQEMQPMEDRISFETIKDHYGDIVNVISDMAMLAASSQIRSSGREGSAIADDLIVFGQNTNWQEDLIRYAREYSRQVKKDYRQFVNGWKKANRKE